jgi:glycosyltransferase involved in cell wall biosynthesis
MTDARQSWSIVVLCFNEAANIERVVGDVARLLDDVASPEREIVIVDDGSTDGSRDILERLAARLPIVRLALHERNLGIGEALRTGYRLARFENVCAVPGDGQFDLDELRPWASLPAHEFVSFTRRENAEYSPFRRGLTWVNRQVNVVALGAKVRDANWVKLYKRDALARIELESRSSLLQSEVAAKMLVLGERMHEPDSKYLPRAGGRAKGASLKIVAQAARETITLARIVRRFRRKLRATGNHASG